MARMKTAHLSPRDKWKKVLPTRLQALLSKIDSLGKLSDSSNYSFTQGEVEQVFEAIEDRLSTVRESFERGEVMQTGALIEFEDGMGTDDSADDGDEDETGDLEVDLDDLE